MTCDAVVCLYSCSGFRYDTIAEGIGNDHVTGNFGKAILDDAFRVSDQESVYMAHYLLRHEGETLASAVCIARTGTSHPRQRVGRLRASRAVPA